MANYDRHLDFNSSMGVSKISPKDPPLSPIDSSPGGGGGLTDSGFETFDLLGSPISHNNGDDSLMEQYDAVQHNGKHSPSTNNGVLHEHDFYEREPEDEDEDEELFDSMVSSPPKSDGRKALNGPSRDFMDLDFFDPLAPLPEEFPSPQESSSPQKFPSSPSKDIPEEAEEYSNSPNDVERDYFEGDDDSPYNPSSPQPDTDEPHDSLSDSNTGSFPCADVTASPKDVPLHCYPSRDLLVHAPQRPPSHGDSGTECDSLEDPPALHVHALHNNNNNSLHEHNSHLGHDDSPHVSGAMHDVSSADERTVNDSTAQLEHDDVMIDEDEITRPIEDEDDDIIDEMMEELPVHTASDRQTTFTSEVRLPERTEAKVVETGISFEALKSTYSIDVVKEDNKDKEHIETGISIQQLKSTYLHNGHVEPEEEKPSLVDKEVVSTGVDIKTLRASYCDLVKMDDNRNRERQFVQTGINIRNLKTSFSTTDPNEDPGVKIDRARITRSFSQVMGKDEKANLCRVCGKPVFLMDRIKAEKGVFHKGCFRCKECSKPLTLDTYSSHEGIVYCKPHFKSLFQPKANFEEETGHVIPRPRRHELIIKENTPMELPPDVIRSSDKTDYGLEELPSLRNIKSRFESGDGDGDLVRSNSQVSVKRSESILSRMAKFQSLNENGHYEDSDSSSDEEETRDPDVIRETRKKEKVVFSGMTDLKSQWENGSDKKTKEEYARETQEELNKLRQRICHGKGNLKAVYENAIQESEKAPEKVSYIETHELGGVKEKWERGEVLNEVEQEKLDKYSKEREEDLSVFKDLGTSAEARTIFKKIDETVVKTGTTVLKKSPSIERSRSTREVLYSNHTNSVPDGVEIVRSGERKDEVIVDPTVLSEKFKFFENYQDPSKQERKRFTITPPREAERDDSPEVEISRDPNVVRACDQEDDIIVTDTAKKMLNKFRELENQSERDEAPQGPKPLKRITPPREYTTYSDHDSSPEPERDPNIVRACDKIEDTILIEAERTRSLRAKFENWEDNDVESENYRNLQDDVIQPSIDTTKNLKAKFEALREENAAKPVETPKHKVNRFVDYTGSGVEQCAICGKRVYAMEKVEAVGHKFHKGCFKCSQCSCILRLDNYTTSEGVLYCTPHFKQLFITKGNYDEGFGREQHKEKWNRSRSTTPTSKEFSGFNGNGDYSETEEIYA